MKILTLAALIFVSLNASARISGYHDSTRKIQAVMMNSIIANSLRQAPITQIQVDGMNVMIKTASCARAVTLKTLPSRGLGAPNYTVASISTNACN